MEHVTKFLPADVYEFVLSGSVKFGCLSEYRAAEGGADHRLVDPAEGVTTRSVKGDLINTNFNVGTTAFRNCTVIGGPGGTAFEYNEIEEALVFCTSVGSYSAEAHRKFREAGNESCDHYVVFDLHRLRQATAALAQLLAPGNLQAFCGAVHYAEKQALTDIRGLEAFATPSRDPSVWLQKVGQNVFVKPQKFKHEQEFRYALVSTIGDRRPLLSPVFVATQASAVQGLFKDAVVASGSWREAAA